jgi:hypothetical protein
LRPNPGSILRDDLVSGEGCGMSQDKPPISVNALLAEDYSTDGNHIIISLTVKFLGKKRKYSVPVKCFYDFIASLQRLNAMNGTKYTYSSIQSVVNPKSAEKIEG